MANKIEHIMTKEGGEYYFIQENELLLTVKCLHLYLESVWTIYEQRSKIFKNVLETNNIRILTNISFIILNRTFLSFCKYY